MNPSITRLRWQLTLWYVGVFAVIMGLPYRTGLVRTFRF